MPFLIGEMYKIARKIRFFAVISMISVNLAPFQASAFWGSFLRPENLSFSPLAAFLSNEGLPWNKVIEINGPGMFFNIASENYLIAANIPTSSKKSNAPNKNLWVTATGYSSTKDQTDSTPFITASGTHVRDGVIAANFLPIGTIIKIPEIFGDKVFIVEDRMHQRYDYRVDIWFPERNTAKEFGVQKIKIEIVS